MDLQDLLRKLDQIEEQAQLTLDEFPKTLTKERQRMIIALARCLRAEASSESLLRLAESPKAEQLQNTVQAACSVPASMKTSMGRG
jgi:hypothetical protein